MNIGLQLYEINKDFESLIEDEENINLETGELTEDAINKMNSLQIQKQDLIHYVGLSYHSYNAEASKVDVEIERLSKIKKHYTSRVNAMKKLLEKSLRLGEEMKFDNLELKWKKNPKSVETDIDFDLQDLQIKNPELVKISLSLDKVKIKELEKIGKPLPAKIRVIQNNSLVIK